MPFSTTLAPPDLARYVARQMATFFPDGDETAAVERVMKDALGRLEHCFNHARLKCFWSETGPRFNHLHTDQSAIFLYYLSNSAFKRGEMNVAAKAYALNKALHGLDAFYEVELPAIFTFVHPVGTVLGRATYGDYLCVYQNVTVGADPGNAHPVIGRSVILYGGSRVIGTALVGDNAVVSVGTTILGGEVPAGHVAFGQHPNVRTKPTRWNARRDVFADPE